MNITKSITLSGIGMNASILGSGTNGITINAGPTDVVTLRHLQINGSGTGLIGIRVLAGGAVIVDDVTIYGFETGIDTAAAATTVLHSVISNSRVVAVSGRGGTLTVESSMITSNNVAASATYPGVVRLSDNGIYNNYTSFGCGTGTLASAGDNRTAGNGLAVPTCPPTVGIAVQ